MTPEQKAMRWFITRDTGLSSEAIMAHMIGGVSTGRYPLDPDDLGRCLRLLKRVPEWKPRIGEMKKYGLVWKALSCRWDEIEKSMRAEVGIDWSKGDRAPKTYELMQLIIAPAESAERERRRKRADAKAAKEEKARKRGGKR